MVGRLRFPSGNLSFLRGGRGCCMTRLLRVTCHMSTTLRLGNSLECLFQRDNKRTSQHCLFNAACKCQFYSRWFEISPNETQCIAPPHALLTRPIVFFMAIKLLLTKLLFAAKCSCAFSIKRLGRVDARSLWSWQTSQRFSISC